MIPGTHRMGKQLTTLLIDKELRLTFGIFFADAQASKPFRTLTVFVCISGVIFFGSSTNASY